MISFHVLLPKASVMAPPFPTDQLIGHSWPTWTAFHVMLTKSAPGVTAVTCARDFATNALSAERMIV